MERYVVKHYYQTETSVSNLPLGSFTYNGVASFSNSPAVNTAFSYTAAVLAKIQLDLNFVSNFVSGKITNVKNLKGSFSSGTLNISNGNLVDNSFIDDTNGPTLHQG